MASVILRNSAVLSDYGRPYIVAEINTSHFGNLDTAKQMITRAKEIGVDCVKFQSWSAETLYSKSYYDENPIAKRFVEKLAFSDSDLFELAEYCKKCGISFASTPYSRDEVDFLVQKCDVPYIKVASMELNNLPYLEYIGLSGVPVVLSTGMGDFAEIGKAVATIERTGNRSICILHCVSNYPAEMSAIRLRNIVGLREAFPDYAIGYSDHSVGTELASAAVALGACMIEKHFTLDQKKIGMDNQMATEPGEMAILVRNCRNVHLALGDTERIVSSDELAQRKKMRRSIVAATNLKVGATLKAGDLDAKRPGTGLSPEKIHDLIGRTVLRDIEADTLIRASDISE